MNKRINILKRGLVLFILSSFYACNNSHSGKLDHVGGDSVLVQLSNQSGQNVKRVLLRHEEGEIAINSIEKGESARVVYKSPGENSFRITVTFEKDSTLESGGVYTEGGYRITQTIYKDDIDVNLDQSY